MPSLILLASPATQVLGWRLVAKRRMLASIPKHINVFEAGILYFSTGSVTQTMIPLVLETFKPALGRRVDDAPATLS